MPDLPASKIGIVACSGEELPEGTVTRLAALQVLEHLRPRETVTICLPLFLAGGEGDRAFARFHPTITVDGCEKRCAARATEMHSGKPAASVVVTEIVAERGIGRVDGRRRLNEAGLLAVVATAERVSAEVDNLVARRRDRRQGIVDDGPEEVAPGQAACSCGSGIPMRIAPVSRTATYHTTVTWKGEHLGHVALGNGPEMDFSAPPDAHGHAGVLTPEDAFVAAVNTCIMMMFVWAAERFDLHLLSYECRAEGTKRIELDRTEIFTRVLLKPVIRIGAAGEDPLSVESRTRRALQAARKYSLVAASIRSDLILEPTIHIQEEQ